MKKYWKQARYKAYLRKHSLAQDKARQRFKARRRLERAIEGGYRKKERTERRNLKRLKYRGKIRHYSYPLRVLTAPEHFSFVENPDDVCHLMEQLSSCCDLKQSVDVDLSGVTQIDYATITVLLSVMSRFKSQGIYFNGKFPRDRDALSTLIQSGFFRRLERLFGEDDSHKLADKSSILTHAKRKVDSELSQKAIRAAAYTIWGEPRRSLGAQRTLVELMHNTNNHASLMGRGEHAWWLSVCHHESENRVSFAFVDYGVGVFVNLENKSRKHWFQRWIREAKKSIGLISNPEILRRIFSGEVQSSSGKSYRGKGLPGIYDAFKKNRIAKLVMITNDVFFDGVTDTYRQLPFAFGGTFVYWELNRDSKSLPDAT